MNEKRSAKKIFVIKRFLFMTVIIAVAVFMSVIQISAVQYDDKAAFTQSSPFILFDFDDRKLMNSVNGQAGVFDGDPQDSEAYCRSGFSKDEDLNKTGYQMKLSYDVDSSKPAFNGFWAKLNGIDLSGFEALSFNIKGDKEKGFSDIFKIEMKDKSKKIEYIVDGVKDVWTKIVIPFADFEGDPSTLDWKAMNEFVIVFEDWRLKTKVGRYSIDDIAFVPKKGVTVKYTDIVKRK